MNTAPPAIAITTSTRGTKVWANYEKATIELVDGLAKAINISPALAEILIHRGITDFDTAKDFFRPSLAQLHDPFLMKDMDKAVARLNHAVANKEQVLIYGDYDVDGTTAVSLFYGFFSKFHPYIHHYIPDRYKEGYGVSKAGIDWAVEHGVTLIVSLDCGIKATEKIIYAKSLGIDFIVCDHHQPDSVLPPAVAVLDPKREDCAYPFKELSGCGVGFKLLQAYCINQNIELELLYQYLDLVAISIAADIVPIVGENRILTYFGLQIINQQNRPGIKSLAGISGFKKNLTVTDVVFGLSPRINAAGRIGHGGSAVSLLLSSNETEANEWAEKLNDKNALRKDYDQLTTQEAIEMILASNCPNAFSTVLFKDSWHKGVVGIVASRCIEQYHRPTIILTEADGKITGSARSVEGFDLYGALLLCDDLLEQWGGHTHAAGLTLKKENLEEFQLRFEQVVASAIAPWQLVPRIKIDGILQLSQITDNFYNIIAQMQPFGPGNMQPTFISQNVIDTGRARILKEKHLKLTLTQPDSRVTIDAIGFGMGHFYDKIIGGVPFHICYQIDRNEFQGRATLQLMLKDIKFHP